MLIGAIRSAQAFRIRGILDKKLKRGVSVLGFPVLGNDDLLMQPENRDYLLVLGIGSVRAGYVRKEIYERYRGLGYEFPVIRHASTLMDPGVEIEDGCQIMAGVVVQTDAHIGANCILNTACIVEHDCLIAAHGHVGPGAVLGGGVTVGEGSLVGLGARVLPGIKIGRGTTIGAGAVVIRDVGDGLTVAGNPARPIREL